ncbi:maleylpyruvate isomerase N-terminal domain-containing protein [Gordonia humi]|uniref:Uncharacterized protein (TIGR03086 family) n=1 Tax=Gordonia humi TaxID=686429 RepID=A0A840F0V7_9ACTN|nr:maleylpyruvate isomerase N-terminal domain-containing protein [Gordonia humi]MBB4136123.1 uncharacterized protein (TIGR03086 family) [Gordonia humi]
MTDHMLMLAEGEGLWESVSAGVSADQLGLESGCAGWSNRDLLNHVIAGGHRYSMLLDGATVEETAFTRDLDYVAAGSDEFRRYEDRLHASIEAADLAVDVDHRAGRRPGRDLIPMRTMELVLHTRDLCDGIGAAWEPSATIVDYLLTDAASIIEDLRDAGAFDPATTPTSSSAVDRLLAFAGRA